MRQNLRTMDNILIMDNIKVTKSDKDIVTINGDAMLNPRSNGLDAYTKATLTGENEEHFGEEMNELLLMCLEEGLLSDSPDEEDVRMEFDVICPVMVKPADIFIPKAINGYDIHEALVYQKIRKRLRNKRRNEKLKGQL